MTAASGLRDGAKQDFELALRTYGRGLFALAYEILRDASEAEDAVQDTMEVAWNKWTTLREPSRREAWLRKICLRRCLRLKTRLRWRLVTDHDYRLVTSNSPHQDPDLVSALGDLSPHQRAVLVLHYHGGYSLEECAQLMGCRIGTVKSHLSRGLSKLRRELRYV